MPRRDPFREIEELFERMGREFEELGSGIEVPGSSNVRVDVAEDDENVIVTADLPGYERDDIDVELREDTLTIAATHEDESVDDGPIEIDETDLETADGDGDGDDDEATALRYHRRERRRRAVSRRITLPAPVNRDGASAAYNNGVLTVTLPKRSAGGSGGHAIDVK